MKLKDALDGYWLEKRRNLSKHTVADYQLTFKRFTAFVGDDIDFEKISATHVRVFLEDMKQGGLAAKSVLNCWTALSSLWTWAENELGTRHIMRGKVQKPKTRRAVIEPYSRQEVASLLNACTNNAIWYGRTSGKAVKSERPEKLRDRAVILTLLDTGVRAQELCNLRMKDFDAEAGRLHVRHGKGDKSRLVYMGESARKALWRYQVERGKLTPEDAIFAGRLGKPMDTTALRKMIINCAHRAGVLRPGVHRFRRTFAINFLRNGGSVLELQHMLGHERLDTVRIYASLAESGPKAAQARSSPADKWNL